MTSLLRMGAILIILEVFWWIGVGLWLIHIRRFKVKDLRRFQKPKKRQMEYSDDELK